MSILNASRRLAIEIGARAYSIPILSRDPVADDHGNLRTGLPFQPSCSEYARQAIETYGAMRGVAMAMRRLARCHPLGGHGHDPVPARAGHATHE